MPYTRVKICGITRPQDAQLAAELGADAIGLNLLMGPRQITPDQACSIYWSSRPETELGDDDHWICGKTDVVVLCATSREEFPKAATRGELLFTPQIYQLYGRYEQVSSGDLNDVWWGVFHVNTRDAITNAVVQIGMLKKPPAAILLDAGSSEKLGGTGQTFNWNWIAEARDAGELQNLPPLVLAGGLTPDNVAEAIRIVRPYAVDVSSGVEVPNQPGIKDPIKLRDFIQAAKSV